MRLARIGAPGNERPAVIADDGTPLDISRFTIDIDGPFLATGLDAVRVALSNGDLAPLSTVSTRYGPPVASIGKIVCVGLNYSDHAAETGATLPTEPILFLKTPDTVIGPDDEVLIPRLSTRTDYEIELAIVIGGIARYLESPADAARLIAGYTISNDVSEREFQIDRGGQWDKGKNCETFNPLGPWVVTSDDIADPQSLDLKLWVNDEIRQNGNTASMVFDVHHLVWYISQFLVLRPGDIINTGTPAGVALGRADNGYLRTGDTIRLEIDQLGSQRQRLGAA